MRARNDLHASLMPDSISNNGLDHGFLSVLFNMHQPDNIISTDNFYQTGYEFIFFQKDHEFALETVLTSAIPFEKSIIIINTGENTTNTVEFCLKHDLNYRIVGVNQGVIDWLSLEYILKNSTSFSHICVSMSSETRLSNTQLMQLGKLVDTWNLGLIVNCLDDSAIIHNVQSYNIDYLIGRFSDSQENSVVLARRSKLVQTEGNARSSNLDLYQFWQSSLWGRKREIEPMAF